MGKSVAFSVLSAVLLAAAAACLVFCFVKGDPFYATEDSAIITGNLTLDGFCLGFESDLVKLKDLKGCMNKTHACTEAVDTVFKGMGAENTVCPAVSNALVDKYLILAAICCFGLGLVFTLVGICALRKVMRILAPVLAGLGIVASVVGLILIGKGASDLSTTLNNIVKSIKILNFQPSWDITIQMPMILQIVAAALALIAAIFAGCAK